MSAMTNPPPDQASSNSQAGSPDAFTFTFDLGKDPGIITGELVAAYRYQVPKERPHFLTVGTEVDNGRIGPFQLEKEPKARILVLADYRRAKNGQACESPYSYPEDDIDLPHFSHDFRFQDADQAANVDDWPTYTGPISWTFDLLDSGTKIRPDADKGNLFGLTVTVRARFIQKGVFHEVTLRGDPVPDFGR